MQVLKNEKICDDNWQTIDDIAHIGLDNVIVPFDLWQDNQTICLAHLDKICIQLEPDCDLEDFVLAVDIHKLPQIAIAFPSLTDGRGYSLARLLRERYHYTGDLRAIGDVLVDQLWAMHRCGFNVLVLREDQDLNIGLSHLHPFSTSYQTDVHEKQPLYNRM